MKVFDFRLIDFVKNFKDFTIINVYLTVDSNNLVIVYHVFDNEIDRALIERYDAKTCEEIEFILEMIESSYVVSVDIENYSSETNVLELRVLASVC